MAALKKITTKKKKPTVSLGRKSITAEEKHVGLETVDWTNVKNMKWAVYDTLRHYNYFYDYKEAFKWASTWVKKYKPKDYARFQKIEQWRINTAIGGMCRMHMNGAPFDAKQIQWIHDKLDVAMQESIETKEQKDVTSRTIADIMKEKTSDFIADIEAVLDDFYRGVSLDIENYSVYNELKKIDAPANTAKAIIEYYTPLKNEVEELLTKKTKDLVEGYQHMKPAKKKEYLALLTRIVSDAEKYMASKKAIRKPRAKKVVSVTAQTTKVQYQKESAEFKVTSVDPINIVGATEVYLFSTKYRTLSRLVTSSATGFTIRGTTIQDIDLEKSKKKKLRDPNSVLSNIMSTKAKAIKTFNEVKTAEAETNGRINSETIILKVFK